jgi:hypothetical protein
VEPPLTSAARCSTTEAIIEHQNSVKMVGHDDILIRINIFPYRDCVLPFMLSNQSKIVQFHLPINNFSKKGLMLMSTDGNKIRTRLGVVITW